MKYFLILFALTACDREPPHPGAPSLVNGDPRRTAVSVYHDDTRQVTCYVGYQFSGITCFLDITLEDQKRMLAYRDAGLP